MTPPIRPALLRPSSRHLLATALSLALLVSGAGAQTNPPGANAEDDALRSGDSGIDRGFVSPRSGLLTKSPDELTEDERDLLDELYEEDVSPGDAPDAEEEGEADDPPADGVDPFDIFAGPDGMPSGRSGTSEVPVSDASGAEVPTRIDARGDSDIAGEVPPPVSNAAALPAERTGEDDGMPRIGVNPTLRAGIADETPPVNSLTQRNAPARAIERIVRAPGEDAPFEGVGLRVGTTTLYPELYQGVGASSNLDEEAGGSSGAFSETELNLRALSDWARHEAEISAQFSYRRNFGGETPERPEASIDARLGLDLGALTSATLRGAARYRKDDPFSAGADFGEEDPEILSSSVSGEIDHEIARFLLTGGMTLARENYIEQPEGIPDLSYTTATATGRLAYRISPAFAPFLAASYGKRFFDDGARLGGEATIPSLRAGVLLDFAEKLSGEIGLGYAWNRPDEGRTTGSPTLDALLTWSPRRGTDVVLEARTSFEPDETAGSNTDYEASIAILHALNASFDLNGALRAELETDEAPGSDPYGLAAEIGFTYWLNRTFSFVGLYEYERRFETDPGDDWSAHTVSLGVRLQR